jgi:peptidoglycan glycosyltransferase
MNRQLNRLAVAALVLLIALVVGTTYWQTWASAGLKDRQDNAVERVAQFKIDRGRIVAANGTVLATSFPKQVKSQTFYFRRYPARGLAAQTVGYSTVARSQAGLEKSENDFLTASNANLSSVFDSTLAKFSGATVHGNNVVLSIDPRAQRVALQQLGNRCGAVAALEPATGKVLVMASSPTYDPNLIEKKNGFAKILHIRGSCGGESALLNRATDGLFTPGSSFKLVTVSAALDTGKFTPDSQFYDPGYCVEYGKQVSNAGAPDGPGPETFGNVTLSQGLIHSINSVFCNVGKALGARIILDYAKRYGFYSVPPLETPVNERAPSGLYNGTHLYDPKDQNKVDPGRLAFGQERMLVTPLQMAMVAGAIANGGRVMRPYVVEKVTSHGGGTVETTHPSELGRAIKPQTAQEITQMMIGAVQSGTGTAAQIPGVQVAGKTGTAESAVAHVNTTWFVCFAPANAPRFVVAVVLEKQHGFGGQFSAPVAKQVLLTLLRSHHGP